MMAKHIYTYANPTSVRDLEAACEVLKHGGLIAYPTDVNWAIGCDASMSKAIGRIQKIKPLHPKKQPFSLLCHSISMISEVAHIEHFAYRLLKKTLPGPYTYLFKRNKNLPKQINDKRKVVGVRVPDCELLLDLVKMYNKPLLTTSLPQLDEVGAQSISFGYEIEQCFGHQIDLILDLGEEVLPHNSTIVDFSEGQVEVLRVGLGDTSLFDG